MSMPALRASIVFCDRYPDLTVGAITCRHFAPWNHLKTPSLGGQQPGSGLSLKTIELFGAIIGFFIGVGQPFTFGSLIILADLW
jgi:hypothetical protein